MPLRWVHQEVNPAARSVGPQALCEFLDVVESKWLHVSTLVELVGFPLTRRREPLKDWVITVQARGLEADSPEKRFTVSWDQQWHPGEKEMGNHLVLRELPPARALSAAAARHAAWSGTRTTTPAARVLGDRGKP